MPQPVPGGALRLHPARRWVAPVVVALLLATMTALPVPSARAAVGEWLGTIGFSVTEGQSVDGAGGSTGGYAYTSTYELGAAGATVSASYSESWETTTEQCGTYTYTEVAGSASGPATADVTLVHSAGAADAAVLLSGRPGFEATAPVTTRHCQWLDGAGWGPHVGTYTGVLPLYPIYGTAACPEPDIRVPAGAQVVVGSSSCSESGPGLTRRWTWSVSVRKADCDPTVDSDGDGVGDCAEFGRSDPYDRSSVPAGSPGAGDPGAGDPGAGDPGAGDPGAGDPGAGDPGAGGPGAGDPGAGSGGTGGDGSEGGGPDPSPEPEGDCVVAGTCGGEGGDLDRDGIRDDSDACPRHPGVPDLAGCPPFDLDVRHAYTGGRLNGAIGVLGGDTAMATGADVSWIGRMCIRATWTATVKAAKSTVQVLWDGGLHLGFDLQYADQGISAQVSKPYGTTTVGGVEVPVLVKGRYVEVLTVTKCAPPTAGAKARLTMPHMTSVQALSGRLVSISHTQTSWVESPTGAVVAQASTATSTSKRNWRVSWFEQTRARLGV